MKRILFALVLFGASAQAQNISLQAATSYTTADTTDFVAIQPLRPYSLVFWAKDSCNVSIRADLGSDSTSAVFFSYNVEADSTNSTTAAGFQQGYLLRGNGTDNIPGASRIRLIVTPKTTGNGTTTAVYSAWLEQQ